MRTFKRLATYPSPTPPPDDAALHWREARFYKPDPGLVSALELAMALGQPLLITGEPGCGKTAAAYWAAWRMGVRPADLVHAQVHSDATAGSLKYEFDAINYFRAAQSSALRNEPWQDDRGAFIQKGPLWRAFEASQERTTILLLDEIDKAPRDLPNDLLHEFDQLEFEVPDWPEAGCPRRISARNGLHSGPALIVLTSNGERRLPDAFLRRCLHHHLTFNPQTLQQIVEYRMQCGDLEGAGGLLDLAIERFVTLRGIRALSHRPGTAEFLVWLRVMSMSGEMDVRNLQSVNLLELPYLGTMLKEPADLEVLAKQSL